jgi:putative ABC transport system permease protein
MVTHNRKLADQYSDRIIEMADGLITKDSKPEVLENKEIVAKEVNKKTSMSFLTALKSSLSNIRTKKTRTILTAVASSFGIIGVALVLALSNGFGNYVHNVETSVASAVPISITPLTTKYTNDPTTVTPTEYPDDGNLHVPSETSAYATIHRNNYGEDYFNYINKVVDLGYASTPLYNRVGLDYHLLTNNGIGKNKDEIIAVDGYQSASSLGDAISSVTALPTYIFHELYGTKKDMSSWYDVLSGSFPTNKNEVCLITDRYNQVDRSTLKSLGLLSKSDIESNTTVSFDQFVGKKTYKAYRNVDWYRGVSKETYQVDGHKITGFDESNFAFTADDSKETITYYNTTDDNKTIYDTKSGAIELKIVGVLRPSKSSYINLMPASIGFTSELKDYLVEDGVNESTENATLDAELKKVAISNVYMRRDATDKKNDGLNTLNTFLSEKNAINTDKGETRTLVDIINIIKAGQFTTLTAIDQSKIISFFSALETELPSCYTYNDYWYSGRSDGLPNTTSLYWFLFNCRRVGAELLEDQVTIPSSSSLASYITFLQRITDPTFFSDVNNPDRTNWTAIDLIALENQYSLITSILIFPSSLTTKEALSNYLDAYNDGKSDDEQIWYSDIMSTFTNSLGVLINVITTVLIVFASISLVVSCIMTGIITYVSVIERTKEIGILRACGARKKDVGRLFEAECVIVGAGAGLIGILVTVIACYPISAMINNMYPGNNLGHICELSPMAALILFAISIVLAIISGVLPARIAAKKDPVTALRTE